VLIGQLDIKVPVVVKNVFFDLFLFTTGYKVGPQFFRGLKKDALPQLAVTVVLCVTCLLSALTASKLSATTWGRRLACWRGPSPSPPSSVPPRTRSNRLDLLASEKTALVNTFRSRTRDVSHRHSIHRVVPAQHRPRLMRVNLREESKKLQDQIAGAPEQEPGVQSALQRFAVRAYRVTMTGW